MAAKKIITGTVMAAVAGTLALGACAAPSVERLANAIRCAKQYLQVSAFSRQGLIRQLEFEGFSTADATRAVDGSGADFNAQAAKSAKQYLEVSAFSRQALIDQLVFEGYTQSQAEYGVAQVGL